MATYDRSEAASQPCESWSNGNSGGSIPHQAWGIAGGAGFVSNEVYCVRCDEYLYSYSNRDFGPSLDEVEVEPRYNPRICSNTLMAAVMTPEDIAEMLEDMVREAGDREAAKVR